MKSLIKQRLSELNENDRIKVICKNGTKFSGEVKTNDHCKSMELINEYGELFITSYKSISSFIVYQPETTFQSEISENNETISYETSDTEQIEAEETQEIKTELKLNPIQKPDSSAPLKTKEYEKARNFFDQKDFIKVPSVSSNYIASLYENVVDKKSIMLHFNRFMQHLKITHQGERNQKCSNASDELKKSISIHSADTNIIILLANMYAASQNFKAAAEMFKYAFDYYNTALYSFLNYDHFTAASAISRYIMTSKEKNDITTVQNSIYILIRSTILTDDCFALCSCAFRLDQFTCGNGPSSDNCINYLLEIKNCSVNSNDSYTQKVKRIKNTYSYGETFSNLQITQEYSENMIFGYIISGSNKSYNVVTADQKKTYSFNDTEADQRLITEIISSGRELTDIYAVFTAENNSLKARNVRLFDISPEEMTEMAEELYRMSAFSSSLLCYFCALNHGQHVEKAIIDCYFTLIENETEGNYLKALNKFVKKYRSQLDEYYLYDVLIRISFKSHDFTNINEYFDFLLNGSLCDEEKVKYAGMKTDFLFTRGKYQECSEAAKTWIMLAEKCGMISESEKAESILSVCLPFCSTEEEHIQNDTQEAPEVQVSDDQIAENVSVLMVTEPKNTSDECPSETDEESSETEGSENLRNQNTPHEDITARTDFITPVSLNISNEYTEINLSKVDISEHYDDKQILSKLKKHFMLKGKERNKFLFLVDYIFHIGIISEKFLISISNCIVKDNSVVSYVLDHFYESGLISQIYPDKFSDPDDRYYMINDTGKNFFTGSKYKKAFDHDTQNNTFISGPDDLVLLKYSDFFSKVLKSLIEKQIVHFTSTGYSYLKGIKLSFFPNSSVSVSKPNMVLYLLMPFASDDFDQDKYSGEFRSIISEINELKNKAQIRKRIIIYSEKYSSEWTTIIEDALKGALNRKHIFNYSGNDTIFDSENNQITAEDFLSSLNDPQLPAVSETEDDAEQDDKDITVSCCEEINSEAFDTDTVSSEICDSLSYSECTEEKSDDITDSVSEFSMPDDDLHTENDSDISDRITDTTSECSTSDPYTENDINKTDDDIAAENEINYSDETDQSYMQYDEAEETDEYFEFMNEQSDSEISPDQFNNTVKSMLASGSPECAVTYVKAVSEYNEQYYSFYKILSLALDNPAEDLMYTSSEIFSLTYNSSPADPELYNDCLTAARIRALYRNDCEYDYSVNSFSDTINSSDVSVKYPELREITSVFSDFRKNYGFGMEYAADHCTRQNKSVFSKIAEITEKAKRMYDLYSNHTEPISNLKVKTFKASLFSEKNELLTCLKAAADDQRDKAEEISEIITNRFIRDKCQMIPSNISDEKISDYIAYFWNQTDYILKSRSKTFSSSTVLPSEIRSHSELAAKKIAGVVCEWLSCTENAENDLNPKAVEYFRDKSENILSSLKKLIIMTSEEQDKKNPVLHDTFNYLYEHISGNYNADLKKYYFIDFLKNSFIILDSNGIPDMSASFSPVNGFSITERIIQHFNESSSSFENRINEIFSRDPKKNDYGTAAFIGKYFEDTDPDNNPVSSYISDISSYENYSYRQAARKRKRFSEDTEMLYINGCIDEKRKNTADLVSSIWFGKCHKSRNYGFYFRILDAMEHYLSEEYSVKETVIRKKFDAVTSDKQSAEKYKALFEEAVVKHNFILAEDYINELNLENVISTISIPDASDSILADFWKKYDRVYRSCVETDVFIDTIIKLASQKPGFSEEYSVNWISSGTERIKELFSELGWKEISVQHSGNNINGIEVYSVTSKISDKFSNDTVFRNDVFGCNFDVLCVFGKNSADDIIKKISNFGCCKNTMILLDYALTSSERHMLAGKLRMIPDNRYTISVTDRVVYTYIMEKITYDPENIKLSDIILPLSDYQPYDHDLYIPEGTAVKSGSGYSSNAGKLIVSDPLKETGMYFSDQSCIRSIVSMCGYSSETIKYFCSKLTEMLGEKDHGGYCITETPPYYVTETQIRKVICETDFRNRLRSDFLNRLGYSSTESCSMYYTAALIIAYLCCTDPDKTGYSADDFAECVSANGITAFSSASISDISNILDELCTNDVLIKYPDGSYSFIFSNYRSLLGSRSEIEEKFVSFME